MVVPLSEYTKNHWIFTLLTSYVNYISIRCSFLFVCLFVCLKCLWAFGRKGFGTHGEDRYLGALNPESETSEDQGRGSREPWHRYRCYTGALLWAALYLGEVPNSDKVQRPLAGVEDKWHEMSCKILAPLFILWHFVFNVGIFTFKIWYFGL